MVGGVNLGDETAGEATLFSDFTVRPLARVFGPRDVELVHRPGDGELPVAAAGVNVADCIIEATFGNPRATAGQDWAHVLLFRATESSFHSHVLTSTGRSLYAVGGDVRGEAKGGSHIDTTPGGVNRVRVLVLQDMAWFSVNGNPGGGALLQNGPPNGDVEALGALSDDLEIAGAVTHISDFTVWSFD